MSHATFAQAVARLDARGIKHSGVVDRGFMDSIYFRDPLGLAWSSPPTASSRRTASATREVLLEAHKLRVARGDYDIAEVHLADAIEDIIRRRRDSLSDDRSAEESVPGSRVTGFRADRACEIRQ